MRLQGVSSAWIVFAFMASSASACAALSRDASTSSGGASSAGGGGGKGGQGGGVALGDGGGGSTSGPQTCAESAAQKSYIGCEYWPTVTLNSLLAPYFDFAVTVANTTGKEAIVDVDRGGKAVAHAKVPPGKLVAVHLPVIDALREKWGVNGGKVTSALVTGGAYHLKSSVPVAVVQWNPLDFVSKQCSDCYSYTNDASTLLPTDALRDDYWALSWPTSHQGPGDGSGGVDAWSNKSGFLAVTATSDATHVHVASTAHVRAGDGVPSSSPREDLTFELNRGDVLELVTDAPPPGKYEPLGQPCIQSKGSLFCSGGRDYDLSGSHVTADKPVQVFAGHDCANIPYQWPACDHMEETMLPTDALSTRVAVTAPAYPPGGALATFVRILSADASNAITFDPPITTGFTLAEGEWRDVGPLTEAVQITGTKRVLVAQYMPGADYAGDRRYGDPSESVAIPVKQYRSQYTFLASPTFPETYVDIIAPGGLSVLLDGKEVPKKDFKAIGTSGLRFASELVAGGAHDVRADAPFGIVSYGYAPNATYMQPGGMDVAQLPPPK